MKILLVDDETFPRQSLRDLQVWNKEGCEFVAEASNGRDALKVLSERNIDLLITDVRMPVMDGIELARAVRKNYPTVRVVVLSAFGDFHVVKDSFRTGVYDYFLKAEIDEIQIHDLIIRIRDEISSSTEGELTKNGYLNHDVFLRIQSEEPGSLPDLLHTGVEVAIDCQYVCFGFDFRSIDFNLITTTAKKLRTDFPCLPIRLQSSKITVITCVPSGIDYAEIERRVDEIPSSIPYDGEWVAAINPFFSTTDSIIDELEIINEKLEKAFFWGWNRLYRHPCESSGSNNILVLLRDKRSVLQTILGRKDFSPGNTKALEIIIDLHMASMGVIDQIRSFFRWAGSRVQDFILENDMVYDRHITDQIRSFLVSIDGGATLPELNESLAGLISDIRLLTDADHHWVRAVKQYIGDRIPQDIHVSKIATHLSVSPEHLSRVFKAQVGISLKCFITQARIDYARSLMTDREAKIYEIADAAGFASVEHFS
ncbi:MAG: response regulator, partial [Spirochaetaceae bacterium]|nr:response regulator [Spirochaetaceae bacterium]